MNPETISQNVITLIDEAEMRRINDRAYEMAHEMLPYLKKFKGFSREHPILTPFLAYLAGAAHLIISYQVITFFEIPWWAPFMFIATLVAFVLAYAKTFPISAQRTAATVGLGYRLVVMHIQQGLDESEA